MADELVPNMTVDSIVREPFYPLTVHAEYLKVRWILVLYDPSIQCMRTTIALWTQLSSMFCTTAINMIHCECCNIVEVAFRTTELTFCVVVEHLLLYSRPILFGVLWRLLVSFPAKFALILKTIGSSPVVAELRFVQ